MRDIENYMVLGQENYDLQETDVWGHCDFCGGEIYIGEEYIDWNGDILCCDDCVLSWAKEECYTYIAGKKQR